MSLGGLHSSSYTTLVRKKKVSSLFSLSLVNKSDSRCVRVVYGMFFTSQHVEGTLFLLLFDLRFLFPPCCSAINRPVPSLSPSPPLDRWSEIRQIYHQGSINVSEEILSHAATIQSTAEQ